GFELLDGCQKLSRQRHTHQDQSFIPNRSSAQNVLRLFPHQRRRGRSGKLVRRGLRADCVPRSRWMEARLGSTVEQRKCEAALQGGFMTLEYSVHHGEIVGGEASQGLRRAGNGDSLRGVMLLRVVCKQ